MSFYRPPGPLGLNPESPLIVGLRGLWVPDGGGPCYDLIGRHPPLMPNPDCFPVQNSPSHGFNAAGAAVLHPYGAETGLSETGVCGVNGSTQVTLGIISASWASNPTQGCLAGLQSSTSPRDRFIFDLSGATRLTPHGLFFDNGTSKSPTATGNDATAERPTAFALVLNWINGGTITAWKDGVQRASVAMTNTGTFNYDTVSIGCRASGDLDFTADTTSGDPTLSNVSPFQSGVFNSNNPVTGDNLTDGYDLVLQLGSGSSVIMQHDAVATETGGEFTFHGHTSFYGGRTNMVALWDRVLTANELQNWSRQPFSLVRPKTAALIPQLGF